MIRPGFSTDGLSRTHTPLRRKRSVPPYVPNKFNGILSFFSVKVNYERIQR